MGVRRGRAVEEGRVRRGDWGEGKGWERDRGKWNGKGEEENEGGKAALG